MRASRVTCPFIQNTPLKKAHGSCFVVVRNRWIDAQALPWLLCDPRFSQKATTFCNWKLCLDFASVHAHQLESSHMKATMLPRTVVYFIMREWTGLSLLHGIACRLFGLFSLSEPEEQKSVQFESNYNKSFSPDLMCQKHLVTRAIYFMCACLRYIAISVQLWYSPGISLDLNS